MERFADLIQRGVREGYSDIHITGGHPVVFRRNGVIHFDKRLQWQPLEVDQLVQTLLTRRELETLQARLSVDLARSIGAVRIRANVFSTMRGLSLAVRLLPGQPPELARLNLYPAFAEFCRLSAGLVLICGATGSGKSTTIAAMVEEINRTRGLHIVTLEAPIEFRFFSRKSFVEQRELGTHFPSYDQGLLDVLREAPDVIVVGELREAETIRLTINAAEAGHLVIASLHASNCEDALYRLTNAFPGDMQNLIRHQLASTIAALIIQKLITVPTVGFRLPLLSVMKGIPAVRSLIRENRLAQIESILQTGSQEGMYSQDKYFESFIARQKQFTPPQEALRPSSEASPESPYQSALVPDLPRRRAADRQALESTGAPERETAPNYGRRYYDRPPSYEIKEEVAMNELIEELKRAKHPDGES
jgi:pilus retraction protein PilT